MNTAFLILLAALLSSCLSEHGIIKITDEVALQSGETASNSPLIERVGINVHHLGGKNPEMVSKANLKWIRMDLEWSGIQPQSSAPQWGAIFAQYELAQKRGFKVFATIAYTPAWAIKSVPECVNACKVKYEQVGDDPLKCQSDDQLVMTRCMPNVEAWENFLEEAAREGKTFGVEYFGIWNEPYTTFFAGSENDYNQLLISGCKALKRGNPQAKCVGPSGALDTHSLYSTVNSLAIARGAGAPVDVIDVHDYSETEEFYKRLKNFKKVLRENGFSQPVWVTETSSFHDEPGNLRPGKTYERTERDVVKKILALKQHEDLVEKIFFYEINSIPLTLLDPYEEIPYADYGFTSGGPAVMKRRPVFNALSALMNGTYQSCPAGQCTGVDGNCCKAACAYRPDGLFDEHTCGTEPAPACDTNQLGALAHTYDGAVEFTYCLILNREADDSGKQFWTNWLQEPNPAHTKIQMALHFIKSQEFKHHYDLENPDHQEVVKALYQVILEREADSGGLEFWSNQMKNGLTYEELVEIFILSDEFKGKYPMFHKSF